MTFNPAMAKALYEIRGNLNEPPTVIEFGNQTLNLTADSKKPDGYVGSNGESAELYYKAFGFTAYDSIDVNDKHGSIKHDLNYDVPTNGELDMSEFEYDLVTNNGTSEHIFDQNAVFRNAHNLCKPDGGVMLHVLPFLNWINHGFWSFHPLLFVDLAAANNYRILNISLSNRWGHSIKLHTHGSKAMVQQIKPKVKSGILYDALVNIGKMEGLETGAGFPNVMVIAALQKTEDSPFNIPFQGKYLKDINDGKIKEEYAGQK